MISGSSGQCRQACHAHCTLQRVAIACKAYQREAGGPNCSGLPPGIIDPEGHSALSAGQHLAKGIAHPGLYDMSGIGLAAAAAQCVVKMYKVL